MATQLTPHFTLQEMVFSQHAIRLGINNTPSEQQIAALKTLCENVLEPLRKKVGKAVHISSGYRSPDLNRAIGGSYTSQHMRGEAADIHVEGYTTQALFALLKSSDLPFDQLIEEFDSWVHVSYSTERQRRQALYAYKDAEGHVHYDSQKPQSV